MKTATAEELVESILLLDLAETWPSRWHYELRQLGFHIENAQRTHEGAFWTGPPTRLAIMTLDAGSRTEATLTELARLHPRPRVVALLGEYSAARVFELARTADLVLPMPLDTEILARAFRWLTEPNDDELSDFANRYRLSPNEKRVLECALLGMNNDEAASALKCQRSTVATYWNRIFRKTGVSGQRDVVVLLLHTIRENNILLRTPNPIPRSFARNAPR